MKKLYILAVAIVPVALIIALIPKVKDDYYLAGISLLIVIVAFFLYHERRDVVIFLVGMILMTVSEYFFIQTGVETFARRSLFGVMPLWLPILWGYGFVAIKRVTNLL